MSAFKQTTPVSKRYRRIRYLLIFPLLGLLLLAACGDTTTPTSSAVTTSVVATPTTNGQPVTIRLATGDSGDGLIPYNKIKDDFEKENPNIKVKIETVTDSDYYGSLMTQAASGNGPDLIQIGDDAVALFVEKGVIENLTPYISGTNGAEKLDTSIYFPGVYHTGTYPFKNKPYLLPKDYTSICIIYNKALFKAANLPEPDSNWTWDDFVTTAQKLTLKDANGKVTQYGAQLPAAWPRGFEALAFTFGAKLISDDGTKYRGFLDSDASVKAMQLYTDLYSKGYAAPPTDITKFQGGNDNFNQGTAAMQMTGHWPQSSYLKNPKLADNLGVVGLPSQVGLPKANIIAWAGFGINSKSPNKLAAWKVLRYFTGVEGAKTWVDWGLSSVQSIASQSKIPLDKVWADQVQYFKPITGIFTPYWNDAGSPEITSVMNTALTDPKANVAELLKNAAAKADQKLQEKIAANK
ncbi:MAG: sugar ABC transporter substrate-binding protein [Chloroflexi bacterium]|nr:sugar ABC transporter substrate-binding protein [Chloroflexota bacterium]